MTSYNLPLPPVSDDRGAIDRLLLDHDQFAGLEVPAQVQTIDGLTVEQNRELITQLDMLTQQHEVRANNLRSTMNLVRQNLEQAAHYGMPENVSVGMGVPSHGVRAGG